MAFKLMQTCTVATLLMAGAVPCAVGQTVQRMDAPTSLTAATTEPEHLLAPIAWQAGGADYKLQVGGDTRIRSEWRDNFDLNDRRNRHDDALSFLRTRVNFDLTRGKMWRAFVELSDSREIDAKREQGQENTWDLQQAYIDWMGETKGPWTLRFGRQEMNLGRDTRLVEASNWNNLRRRFDGARLMYRTEKLDADLFVLKPEYYDRRRGNRRVTENGRMRDEEWFYGGYATLREFEPHTLEAYFLGLTDKEDRRTFAPNRRSEDSTYGSSNRYTAGMVLYGPLRKDEAGTLSYTAEGAYQFGRYSKDRIRAFFLRGDLTYEWKRPWTPSLGLVGTWASGDKDPNDGVSGGFDNLFGSNHGPYGIMDFVRARNLRELAVVGKVAPTEKLSFQAEAHSYWLDSKTDTGLSAPGERSLRDTHGRSGSDVGQEISLVAKYDWSKRLNFEAGAAHFFPGGYPAAFGRNDGANFFYLQAIYRF